MKLNVTVYGPSPDVWQSLLGTLNAHEYKVESQSPYTTLTASRGSKALSLLLESTKGGYRDLAVTFSPQGGGAIAVAFDFRFPAWTTVWEGAMKDCRELVAQFEAAAAQPARAPAPPPPAAAAAGGGVPPRTDVPGAVCKACGAAVRPGARFCDACGASLAAPAVCPSCGAPLVPGGRFCEKCGARIGQ